MKSIEIVSIILSQRKTYRFIVVLNAIKSIKKFYFIVFVDFWNLSNVSSRINVFNSFRKFFVIQFQFQHCKKWVFRWEFKNYKKNLFWTNSIYAKFKKLIYTLRILWFSQFCIKTNKYFFDVQNYLKKMRLIWIVFCIFDNLIFFLKNEKNVNSKLRDIFKINEQNNQYSKNVCEKNSIELKNKKFIIQNVVIKQNIENDAKIEN